MNTSTKRFAVVLGVLLGIGLGPWIVEAEPTFSVDHAVAVPMSDGAKLAADLYLPKTGRKFPLVLVRTPYAKAQYASLLGEPLARRGYAVLAQDVRGQQASTAAGEFHPIVGEKQDGLDTLDWIAKQPWEQRQGRHLGIIVQRVLRADSGAGGPPELEGDRQHLRLGRLVVHGRPGWCDALDVRLAVGPI